MFCPSILSLIAMKQLFQILKNKQVSNADMCYFMYNTVVLVCTSKYISFTVYTIWKKSNILVCTFCYFLFRIDGLWWTFYSWNVYIFTPDITTESEIGWYYEGVWGGVGVGGLIMFKCVCKKEKEISYPPFNVKYLLEDECGHRFDVSIQKDASSRVDGSTLFAHSVICSCCSGLRWSVLLMTANPLLKLFYFHDVSF